MNEVALEPVYISCILMVYQALVAHLIKSGGVSQGCLYDRDLIILKILFLCSVRLLYHHWMGHLKPFAAYLSPLIRGIQSKNAIVHNWYSSCLGKTD
eukprot:m.44424 g.44424  ORF g.44424 m.44424 type:complete len:97 (+) comp33522_c0_seq2:448-738(+)